MLKKKGSVLTLNEMIPFLIAVAVIVLLVIFMANLLLSWDKAKKTSESSFDRLSSELALVDNGGTGNYFIFDGNREDKLDFYLVYFGSKNTFNDLDKSFVYLGRNVNRLCVCYEEEKQMTCASCGNLPYPATFEGREGPWAVSSNVNLEIKLNGEKYEFLVKK
jgi:hypothetical protein